MPSALKEGLSVVHIFSSEELERKTSLEEELTSIFIQTVSPLMVMSCFTTCL